MPKKKTKKKLPALAWLNIVVSRLPLLPTQRALGLTPFRSSMLAAGRVRQARAKWYDFEAHYGDGLVHPLDLPRQFVKLLWQYRKPWPPWFRPMDRRASDATHGVVLHTKTLAVLDIIWAIKYCQEAYRKAKGQADKQVEIVELLASLFPPPLLPTTVTSTSFAKLLLSRRFRVFYVDEDGDVKDISSLDPGSDDEDVATWGQLAGMTDRVGKIVATCVNRFLGR
jgi:hypothetical protein